MIESLRRPETQAKPTRQLAAQALSDICDLDENTLLDTLDDDDIAPFEVVARFLGYQDADALIRRRGGWFTTVDQFKTSANLQHLLL